MRLLLALLLLARSTYGDPCPANCTCTGDLLDCSHLGLMDLPSGLPPGARSMYHDSIHSTVNGQTNLGTMSELSLITSRKLSLESRHSLDPSDSNGPSVKEQKVRIIPVDCEIEDQCKNTYKQLGEQSIDDFFEQRQQSYNTAIMLKKSCSRVMQEPSFQRHSTGTRHCPSKSHILDGPRYPQEYDTIDRRRKKKQRCINKKETDNIFLLKRDNRKDNIEEIESSNGMIKLKPEKKVVVSNESDKYKICTSENEGLFYPILRPYKNGLLVVSGKWASTKSSTPEQEDFHCVDAAKLMAKDQTRLNDRSDSVESLEEFDSSASDEPLISPDSDDDIEELALLSQTWCNSHFSDSNDFTLLSKFQKSNFDKIHIPRGDRFGFQMHNLKLSPVEEPSEEYVDTMDELQCFVETVSEYLAEKEEEMNRFGPLPTSKTSSDSSLHKQKNREEKTESIKPIVVEISNNNCKSKVESVPDFSGVKNTVNSLFSSFSEKVGSGAKNLAVSVEKLVSSMPVKTDGFVPTSDGISKTTDSVKNQASSVPSSCKSDEAFSVNHLFSEESRMKEGQKIDERSRDERSGHEHSFATPVYKVPLEQYSKSQSSTHTTAIGSVLGKLNPLNLFSDTQFSKKDLRQVQQNEDGEMICALEETDDGNKFSTVTEPILRSQTHNTNEHSTFALVGDSSSPVTTFAIKSNTEVSLLSCISDDFAEKANRETYTSSLSAHCDLNFDKNNCSKTDESTVHEKDDGPNTGFFQPLRRSLSQLLLPSNVTTHSESTIRFSKVYKSEDDVRKISAPKDNEKFNLRGKIHIPFFDSVTSEKQQDKREKAGFFPALFKFASAENLYSNNQSYDQKTDSVALTSNDNHNTLDAQTNFASNCKHSLSYGNITVENPTDKVMQRTRISNHDGSMEILSNTLHNNDLISESGDNFEEDYQEGTAICNHLESSFKQSSLSNVFSRSSESIPRDELLLRSSSHETQEKTSKQGLFSGLFKFSSAENTHNKQEANSTEGHESRKSSSNGFFSGLLKYATQEIMPVNKANTSNSNTLENPKSFFRNSIPVVSKNTNIQIVSEKQNTLMSKVLNSTTNKSYENISLVDTLKSEESSQKEMYMPNDFQSRLLYQNQRIVPSEVVETETDFQDIHKLLIARQSSGYYGDNPIMLSNFNEHSNQFLKLHNLENDSCHVFDHWKMLEDTHSSSNFEWEYEIGDFPGNKNELLVASYNVENHVSSADFEFTDFWDSSNVVMNLCKKDTNDNIVDWAINVDGDQQSLIFSEMSCESFDQCINHDIGLEENETWRIGSCSDSTAFSPLDDDCNSTLESMLMNLSNSSRYNGNFWTLIDQESLSLDGSFVCSSESQAFWDWLALLECGLWWPSEDGNCGYYMYCDSQFVYSLLTDPTGQYVYVCTPETLTYSEFWDCDLQMDTIPSAWIDDGMVAVCGFKVPLTTEDICCIPKEEELDNFILENPLDLSNALRRGDELMNMNLETFSQMFEESMFSQREQPLDFSSCKLHKIKVDFKSEKEKHLCPLDNQITLDLRTQPKGIILNEESKIMHGNISMPSEKVSPGFFGFQLFQSDPPSSESVSRKNASVCQNSQENQTPINKVVSLFSTLGELIGKVPSSDVMKYNDAPLKKTDAPCQIHGYKHEVSHSHGNNDHEKSYVENTYLTAHSNTPTVTTFSELETIHPAEPNRIFSEKQNTFHSFVPSGFPNSHTNQLKHETIASATSEKFAAPNKGLDESSTTTKEPEETFLKSALKLFNLGEKVSAKPMSDRIQPSGFFDFFKTHSEQSSQSSVDIQEQSKRNTKLLAEKDVTNTIDDMASMEKNELPGISSIFDSIGDLFKVDSSAPKDNSTFSKHNAEMAFNISQHGKCSDQQNSDVSSLYTPSRLKTLKKQSTVQESCGKGQSDNLAQKQTTDSDIDEVLKGLHAPVSKSTDIPTAATNAFGTPQKVVAENSVPVISSCQEKSYKSTISFPKTHSNKPQYTSKEFQSNLRMDEKNIKSPSSHFTKPPPTSQSIFSFFSGSEKPVPSQTPVSNILDGKPSTADDLFKLPALFSRGSTASKTNTPQCSSSFSLFGLSLFSEKPQTTSENRPISEQRVQPSLSDSSQCRISSSRTTPKLNAASISEYPQEKQDATNDTCASKQINTIQVAQSESITEAKNEVYLGNEKCSNVITSCDSLSHLEGEASFVSSQVTKLLIESEQNIHIDSSFGTSAAYNECRLSNENTQDTSFTDFKDDAADIKNKAVTDYGSEEENSQKHKSANVAGQKHESLSFLQFPTASDFGNNNQEPQNEISFFDTSTKIFSSLMTKINIFSSDSSDVTQALATVSPAPQSAPTTGFAQESLQFSNGSNPPTYITIEDNIDKTTIFKENQTENLCFKFDFDEEVISDVKESTAQLNSEDFIEHEQSSDVVMTNGIPLNTYDCSQTTSLEEWSAGKTSPELNTNDENNHQSLEASALQGEATLEQVVLKYKEIADEAEDVNTCKVSQAVKPAVSRVDHSVQNAHILANTEPSTRYQGVYPSDFSVSQSQNETSKYISINTNTSQSSQQSKPMMEMPSLSELPKFNFLPSSTDIGNPFRSLFSRAPTPATNTSSEPGLLSSFKKFSASLFEGGSDLNVGKEGTSGVNVPNKKPEALLEFQKESTAFPPKEHFEAPSQLSLLGDDKTLGMDLVDSKLPSLHQVNEEEASLSVLNLVHPVPEEQPLTVTSDLSDLASSVILVSAMGNQENDGQHSTASSVLPLPSPQPAELPEDTLHLLDCSENTECDPVLCQSKPTCVGRQPADPTIMDALNEKRPVNTRSIINGFTQLAI